MSEETLSEEQSTDTSEELDLRRQLEAAIADDAPDESVSEEPSAVSAEDTEGAGGEGAGEVRGEDTSGQDQPAEAAPEQQEVEPPPIDWDADLREGWKDLPANVRDKVIAREKQIEQAMQGAAQGRQAQQALGQLQQTYGGLMASEGAQNPVQYLAGMLQTVSELKMGSVDQRASKMAELIQRYGVDVKALDKHLSAKLRGQPAPEAAPDANVAAMIDERMAPVNQMMQQFAQMGQQRQMATQQSAQQEVAEFGQSAEFLNDVRMDMADLIDLATRQGREMPLKEAYDKACAMNPKISAVLAQRAEKEKLAQASQTLNGKRAAAASLAPGNQGSNANSGGDSLLSAINAAWDDQLGR